MENFNYLLSVNIIYERLQSANKCKLQVGNVDFVVNWFFREIIEDDRFKC